MHYAIELEGLPPGLVMNKMLPESNKIPKADDEAEGHCHRLPATKGKVGELFFPSEWFKAALLRVAGGPHYKIKLGAKKVSCKQYLAGGTLVVPEKIPLGTSEYEVYTCTAVIQKKRISRSRPRILPWKVSFKLQFSDADDSFLMAGEALEPIMSDMVRQSSIMLGFGDNRPSSPSKPGPHGTAKVLRCELVK